MTPTAESSHSVVGSAQAGLSMPTAFLLAALAIASFHLAYAFPDCALLMFVFLTCLWHLTALRGARQAFYLTLVIGLAIYAPQLSFFWTLFQIGAVPLWIILSCWLALFVVLGRTVRLRFRCGLLVWACLAPFVWTGLEYFRSELYYLRFSWMNVGYAFSQTPFLHYFSTFGVYGIGFVLMCAVSVISVFPRLTVIPRLAGVSVLLLLFLFPLLKLSATPVLQKTLRVAGIQFEFPIPAEIRSALDDAVIKLPDTDVFVLSEYSFNGPVPELIKKWCVKNRKYLIAGGEIPVNGAQYYNEAFVIAPDGNVAFQQDKCVPVQLMKDGLPGRKQQVWDSPWGKIGLCMCYDLSYTRVTDELVRQGAQTLIVPTMDVVDWGIRQHELHGRVGPMRASEYGIPVFRVCSSGISQIISTTGDVLSTAPYAASGATISGELSLPQAGGRIPLDRYLAPISSAVAGILSLMFLIPAFRTKSA